MSEDNMNTIEIRLPKDKAQFIEEIAHDCGLSSDQVVSLMLALFVRRENLDKKPKECKPAKTDAIKGIPGSFITLRNSWRKALTLALSHAPNQQNSEYWKNLIASFDESFDALWELMNYSE